jgi:hypothetical protein
VKTLLSILEERKSLLETKIDGSQSLVQVEGLLDDELDAIWAEYLSAGHLTIPQERLAHFFRDTVQMSVSVWADAIKPAKTDSQSPPPPPPVEETSGPSASSGFSFLRRLLQTLLGHDDETGRRVPPAQAGRAGSAPDNGAQGAPHREAQQGVGLKIDARNFVHKLEGVLGTVDDAIGKQEEATDSEPAQIESFPEVLDFFQEMMCEIMSDNAQLTLRRAKELPRILRNLGIQTEVYRPDDSRGFEKFDFEPSLDPSLSEHITQMPAFIKGGRIIRRGRVIEPVEPA